MSDSVRPQRRQPTRLPLPWDSPGKNTGVGCHFLPQCAKVKSESEVAQSCPTLSNPMDSSLPSSSVHGIFQARVLEWGAIAFSNLPTYHHKRVRIQIKATNSNVRSPITISCTLDKESDLSNICFTFRAYHLPDTFSSALQILGHLNIKRCTFIILILQLRKLRHNRVNSASMMKPGFKPRQCVCRPLTANQFYLTNYKKF